MERIHQVNILHIVEAIFDHSVLLFTVVLQTKVTSHNSNSWPLYPLSGVDGMALNIILPLCPVLHGLLLILSMSLLHKFSHLDSSLPLRLFLGTVASTILLSTCHSSLALHVRTTLPFSLCSCLPLMLLLVIIYHA